MNKQRLFVTCCLSLVTTSMSFALRGAVANDMAAAFHISNEQMGLVWTPASWAFAIAIVAGGALVDFVGMRRLHALSGAGYIVGVLMVTLAPQPGAPVVSLFDNLGTTMLYAGFLIMGLSQGLVEGVINPLTVSVYPEEKTRRLVMLHAWWPGGQIIGGLLAVALTSLLHASWQLKLSLIAVPAAVYLTMALTTRYPPTERVASNVSTAEMWRQLARPLFIVMLFCNGMAAAVELGPDQWFPKVMGDLIPQMQGVVFLVYTAGLMFIIRTFASGVSQKSPVGTLLVCSILTSAGLFWLGGLGLGASPVVAFAAATIFGIGKTYFSPTMMGILSEQLPRGGALVMSIMGGAGMLSVAIAVPAIGGRIDKLGPGAALQMMAWLGVILAALYGAMWLYFQSRGGYKAVRLGGGH